MRLAASVLANQSQAASLVTAPQHLATEFKHLELISTHARQVLMVVVLQSGEVRQQVLTLAEPVGQEVLSATAARITSLCQGLTIERIQTLPAPEDSLTADILKIIRESPQPTASAIGGEVYRDGLLNVLGEPEFAEGESARRALRVLEERPFLENLLTQTVLNTEVGGVQVIIGGEGNWEELSECSIVLSRYGVPDLVTGALGVIGPMRMAYDQTISAVRFVAGILSEIVLETQNP